MTIRPFDPARDAPGVVAVHLEANPLAVMSEMSYARQIATIPERARFSVLVADVDGAVVGRVEAFLAWFADDGHAICNVAVRAAHRRHGIGAALLEHGLAYVDPFGPSTVLADYVESPAGNAFAARHGFREVRAERLAVVDPRAVTDEPPTELDLRPLSNVDPRHVHLVDTEATRDMPSTGTYEETPFDEWSSFVLGHPLLVPDGSFVAYVDGEPAALSLLTADPASGRGMNWFTGTRRAYRGRGLALAVKLATTRWAAANGLVQIATNNDETNAPMLAVNRRLGYRDAGRRVEAALTLR
jgi:GNAT superfamily N-acetyltransferase